MRSLSVLSAVLSFTIASAPLLAQKRPDFSGTWVEDESQRKSPHAAPSSGAGGAKALSGPPPDVVITQTADALTIERTFMSQTTRMTYSFDGKEKVNRTGAQTHTTRTRWEGQKLVNEGSVYQITSHGEDSWNIREVRWITPKGEMAVESTRIDQDGKEATVFRVFRRKG